MADISKIKIPSGTEYDLKDGSAIANITRSGTTFTATKRDGTTFTFTQQDNNTTYSAASSVTDIATTSAVGTSTAYARADHQHKITKATVTSALGYTPPTSQDVTDAFRTNDAMLFKGTLGTGGTVTALPATHYQGWTYKVITAGTYAGQVCEIGDMIICITDGTAAADAHWTVVQSNVDGIVTGPASSTDAHVAVFNGTTGKIIKDSGFTIGKSVPSNAIFTDNDTKNTAGSTDTSSKIFLIGATSQAANPQTYSDDQVHVTSGTLQTNNTQATVNICANTGNSQTAGGLALYGTSPTDYGIAFRGTGNGGKHGGVQGDWAQYHYMTGATNRGWVFRHSSSGNVASIDGTGNAVFNGAATIGGNTTNTSGCKMQYNTTTQALDFIFS